MTQQTTLVWFRQDLRTTDNPALHYACENGPVMPLYILEQDCPAQFQHGGASRWWLNKSLASLNDALDGQLHLRSGDPTDIIPLVLEKTGIKRVVWNRCYEPWRITRDKQLKTALKNAGIEVVSFNGSCLWEPWDVLKADQTPYKVFTPYYRKGCLKKSSPRFPLAAPEHINTFYDGAEDEGLPSLGLHPAINWYEEMEAQWCPGEQGAADKLSRFLTEAVGHYKDARNIPSVTGTSRLSPHLHFGEISPNQAWYAAIDAYQGNTEDPDLDCYLSELGWREFSYYLLYHFPTIPSDNFNKKFDRFPWRSDVTGELQAWQKGKTGIPIVDAGMRELWHTGYMHNRVRMIVGSFLVKNLLIDWREGERWFWDCLLDADLASNSASWQWVAGSGADAAPYFRIFNPVTQGQKFDPDGRYVSKWCPELSKMPGKFIHNPWDAPDNILAYAGVIAGQTYPRPLVDLKVSRQRALDAFAHLKEANT